jgi:hypothetical protein
MSANVGAMNGFSLDFARPDDFSPAVRGLFVLQTLSGLLLSLIGGGVLWARVLGRPYTDGQLTGTALAMAAVAAAVGLLTHHGEDGFGTSLMRGLCAFGNGGVLFGDPPATGPRLSLGLVPMSVLGSLGVVVVRDITTTLFRGGKLPDHAARVLTLTAALYVVALGLLLAGEHVATTPMGPALTRFDALVWAARGWGEPIEYASAWSNGTLAVLLAVAAVGVGTAGTAGAMGLAWLVTVPQRLRPMILNGLTAQAVIAAAALASLAWCEPTLYPVRRALLVVSAVMNLGLSHDALSITGLSLFTLAAAMIAAKLMPLILLALTLLKSKPAETLP